MAFYYGRYDYSIDEKFRTNVPAKFRRTVGDGFEERYVITLGLDQCIYLYPLEQWNAIEEKLRRLSADLPEERRYIRIIGAHASDSKVDAQGRVALPRNLLDQLGIKKNIVIIGAFDHIEIWKPETYDEFMKQGPSYEEIAEQIFRPKPDRR